ncbi:hypothetical protein [Actinoplanes sp. CA-252034]|uniref:hypothetical protein n=1 Tax=Actinoplanes sp. CA-252034 TaxID=3239906 RepID=UPI003D99D932
MRRLNRRGVALTILLTMVAGLFGVPAAPALAAAGDLTTSAGSTGNTNSGNALTVGIGPRGMVLRGTSLYMADQQDHVIRRVDLTTGTLSVVAGMGAANGQGDGGPATAAGINAPWDLAFDSAGNMFIAAMSNHRIRKVDTTGEMSTFYGTGATTVLNNPQGVGLDGSDNVFVADTGNARIVKITPGGAGVTFGTGFALTEPTNIAFDSTGNVLVSDCNSGLDGAIYRYNAAGTARTLIAGNGTSTFGDGVAATASGLECPRGMTVDTTTNTVYLAEAGSNRIRRFTIGGTITTIAGTGTAGIAGDGAAATAATIEYPNDVVRDAATGTLYLSQGGTQSVPTWGIRRFTVGGNISTIAGNRWATYSGDGGAATAAQLYHPGGADFDSSDTMYIADTDNNRIRKVTPGGVISTVAGTGLASGAVGDGAAAASAQVRKPQDVAVDGSGNLYIADFGLNRIRKVTPGGVISTIAGTGTAGSTWTGTATTTQINKPYGIAVVANGDVYFADSGNNRVLRISGATISVVAGTGTAGAAGDHGAATAALLNAPRDVVVDSGGDVYIADSGNKVVRRVRSGIIIRVAGVYGTAGGNGEGGLATAATMDMPAGLALGTNGDLYIADGAGTNSGTGSQVVRRVDKHGVIHLVAGRQGSYSYAGDGLAGASTSTRLHTPARLAFDSSGNLHIASSGELRIRQISLQTSAAWFWVSDAGLSATRVVYGWEFVSRSATAIKSITLTVPVSATTSVYLVDAVNLPTTGTVSLSGGVVTYTLAATVTVPAGRHMHLSIAGFTNTGSGGLQYSTITTLTSGGAAVDVSTSGGVYFSLAAPVLPVPRPAAAVTSPVATKIYVDPLLQPDTTVVTTLTVNVNATNGYALTVSGTALTGVNGTLAPVSANLASAVASVSFGVNRIGYTATVTGQGSYNATAGSYAGYTTGGETAVTSTRPTVVTGDTVQITNRIRIDYLQTAGTYSGTLSYQVTGDH